MYLHNDDAQNNPFCLLQLLVETQLKEPTNQNAIKVSKVVRPTNKKSYYKTSGTSVINSAISPPFLVRYTMKDDRSLGSRNFQTCFVSPLFLCTLAGVYTNAPI